MTDQEIVDLFAFLFGAWGEPSGARWMDGGRPVRTAWEMTGRRRIGRRSACHPRRTMTARETSRRYDRPRRSVLVPWINAAFRALGRWSQPRIDAPAWFRAVDAPPGWDSESFEVLARSLTDEARLTPIGRVLASARVLGALRSQANVERSDLLRPLEALTADLWSTPLSCDEPCFIGCPDTEEPCSPDEARREVVAPAPFAMMRKEVTQEL